MKSLLLGGSGVVFDVSEAESLEAPSLEVLWLDGNPGITGR